MNNEDSANADVNFSADAVVKEKSDNNNNENENENTSTPTPESTSKNEEIVTDNELWKHRLEENKTQEEETVNIFILELEKC